MEDSDEWNEDVTSEFIVSTCQLLPKSYGVVSDLKHDPISSLGCVSETCVMASGSSEEFYIRPLNTCIDDLDVMVTFTDVLAFVEEFPALPNDVCWLNETIRCCKMVPIPSYPGFVRLPIFGIINYNWKYNRYEFCDTPPPNLYIKAGTYVCETNLESSNTHHTYSDTVKGPAIMWQTNQCSKTHDIVRSIWCPQWPREAQDWPKRQRDYGWPSIVNISEVVQNGCHVVYAQHRACRNDIGQWRLSFSVAEVILLQSWTHIQQIVYHLLRFFAKREIIQKDCPKEDEVLCTYHLKTLMLWTCETKSSEWWNSASVIEISCELLKKLSEWIKRRYIPNYFIPDANLFHEPSSSAMLDNTERRLNEFRDSGILCHWFEKNYIQPFIRTHIKVVKTVNDRKVKPHLKDYRQALFRLRKSLKFKSFDILFSGGFQICHAFTRDIISSEGWQPLARSHFLFTSIIRTFHLLVHNKLPILPIPESIWCFTYFDSTLYSLHAACGLEYEKISWDGDAFDEYIKAIFCKPKNVRCQYHIFPTTSATEISRFQYLRAQEYMENLTGSNSRSEFQLMSLLAKEFLRKALEKDDSQSKIIAPAALIYLAALHRATSENQTVMDLCSAFLMCETTYVENETLNAGCLFFIDDVVRIVGFCLLCKKFGETITFRKRRIYLDLRLTPKVFAYYLTPTSTDRFSKHLQLNHDLESSSTTLDQLLLALTKRKLCTSIKSSICFKRIRECIYRRTQSMPRNATFSVNFFIDKEKLIDYLTEYALESMTSFYSVICTEFGINCNTVDCYRALHLYKCRRYNEVLHLCERILKETNLKNDFNEFAFANVLLLPPLDSFFDRDVQSLLGFHTLFFYLSPLNDDMCKFQCTAESTFAHFFARYIYYYKEPLSKFIESTGTDSIKCHYFLERHFVARYLKLRCCIDCNHPRRKALSEFAAMKCTLPFESIMRRLLVQNFEIF